MGIVQPFRDAIKLFSKEFLKIEKINFYIYALRPLLGLFLIISIWCVYPFWGFYRFFYYRFLIFFCLSSLIIYFLLGSGWSRFSKFSSLGSYRSVAQSISYEIRMIFVLISFCWIISSYRGVFLLEWQSFRKNYFFFFPILFIWLIICLAERNRSPFDFSEGESELVSGFNTEYMGGLFSLIFITEYGSIIFLSIFTSFFFLGTDLIISLKAFVILFCFIWIRGSFPRMRYDFLIIIAWKGLLILVLGLLIYLFLLIFFF